MKDVILGGGAGLALGIAMQRLGLERRDEFRWALGLMNGPMLRRLLLALGVGTVLTALMMWLAVIDVDTVAAPPLDGGTLVGGAIFGAVMGYSGLTPASSGAVLGAGRFTEGLCAVAGCLAGAALLPAAEDVFPALRGWLSGGAHTWFRVTLDEKFLLGGGFAGQACLGLGIIAAALFIRREERDPLPEPPLPPPLPPEDTADEAVVVTLPGEEPVVVDTGDDSSAE